MNDDSIDWILKKWPFDPYSIGVRRVSAGDREVLQLRLDMGLLQLEIAGRPDGSQPHGCATYLEFLEKRLAEQGTDFRLHHEEYLEIDREFVQFYHRRVCWLHLHEFGLAVQDAEHTLRLMDFCRDSSDDPAWISSHEQYRPFVLYHHTQAAALLVLESQQPDAAEIAVRVIEYGIEQIHNVLGGDGEDSQFDDDDLIEQLQNFADNLRQRFAGDESLEQKLQRAIGEEDYEQAAMLRDLINRRNEGR